MTGRAGERGAVLVWFALLLPVLLAFAAFVVDVGQAFMLKRHLQASADAAALAAAQDLPNSGTADTVAHDYSAEAAGKNDASALQLFEKPEEVEKELTEFLTGYLYHVRQARAAAAG